MEVKLLWEAAFAVVSLRGNYNLLFLLLHTHTHTHLFLLHLSPEERAEQSRRLLSTSALQRNRDPPRQPLLPLRLSPGIAPLEGGGQMLG